jgi:hypothetical protein
MSETDDYVAIARLQSAYADTVTRRAWPEFHDLFLTDCTVQVDRRTDTPLVFAGPDGISGFIDQAFAAYPFFVFTILNAHTDLYPGGDHDIAHARVYICELRTEHNGRFSQAFGLYQDEYRRVDARWWIARRFYSSLARTGADLATHPHPAPAFGD